MAGSIAHNASDYFDGLKLLLDQVDTNVIDQYAHELFQAWQDDRRVFVFGNGGSAYCASHHVTDYIKTARVDGQKALQAVSLVDNLGLLTALGNDVSYNDIFSYPLEAMAKVGDVAVAISCSGNSPNVVNALEWAKVNGLLTVAITGFQGGKIGTLADLHINIDHDNYGIIEDVQLSVGHIAAQMLMSKVKAYASVPS